MEKSRWDREIMIVCAITAMLWAFGIIFAVVLYLGLNVSECNSATLVSAFLVLAGSIWGILLFRNC